MLKIFSYLVRLLCFVTFWIDSPNYPLTKSLHESHKLNYILWLQNCKIHQKATSLGHY